MTTRVIANHNSLIVYTADGSPIDTGNGFYTISFLQFIEFILNTCEVFNKTGVGIRTAVRIERAFQNETIELSHDDWNMLCQACENPTDGYPVITASKEGKIVGRFNTAHSILPFLDAIADAQEK